MNYDVFLSHNSKDKPSVEQIGHMLSQEYGLTCWLDKWNLVPGEPWQDALEEALDHCQTVAVFVGPYTISPWENEEMRSALEARVSNKEKRVIPVLLPGAPDNQNLKLPRFLSRLTWVDFRSGLEDKNALYRLYCGIQGVKPGAKTGIEENKTKRLSITPKVITFFWKLLRKRHIWIPVIAIIVLMVAILGLSGNLNIDLPVFCGEKLSTSSAYIFQGKKQRDEGKYACAIQSINKGLQLNPNSNQKLNLYYILASVYIAKNDPGKAQEYLDHGLIVNGDDKTTIANLHLGKAVTYCQMQQNIDAIREFDIYFNLNPTPGDLLSIEAIKIRNDLELGRNMSEDCWITLGIDLLP